MEFRQSPALYSLWFIHRVCMCARTCGCHCGAVEDLGETISAVCMTRAGTTKVESSSAAKQLCLSLIIAL